MEELTPPSVLLCHQTFPLHFWVSTGLTILGVKILPVFVLYEAVQGLRQATVSKKKKNLHSFSCDHRIYSEALSVSPSHKMFILTVQCDWRYCWRISISLSQFFVFNLSTKVDNLPQSDSGLDQRVIERALNPLHDYFGCVLFSIPLFFLCSNTGEASSIAHCFVLAHLGIILKSYWLEQRVSGQVCWSTRVYWLNVVRKSRGNGVLTSTVIVRC